MFTRKPINADTVAEKGENIQILLNQFNEKGEKLANDFKSTKSLFNRIKDRKTTSKTFRLSDINKHYKNLEKELQTCVNPRRGFFTRKRTPEHRSTTIREERINSGGSKHKKYRTKKNKITNKKTRRYRPRK